ncbi:hypothetical protein THASP1DRAFT_27822 [Thamnocephalis sphaerospora]|uniref:Uncharacterized protein n=1 Tax=Thamnocephalis sphaerospora TaxID=78915 RepID=A0A4P9XVV1_9FUNG|nr:hypothetical protein THASP1DRAFT_27822 [Thamnocephalis sphaerospora]|eukprot:RKP10413.1 hypothetical protein THASP1DRAFT_27822 [Thamnocephalis sphaerospora]
MVPLDHAVFERCSTKDRRCVSWHMLEPANYVVQIGKPCFERAVGAGDSLTNLINMKYTHVLLALAALLAVASTVVVVEAAPGLGGLPGSEPTCDPEDPDCDPEDPLGGGGGRFGWRY